MRGLVTRSILMLFVAGACTAGSGAPRPASDAPQTSIQQATPTTVTPAATASPSVPPATASPTPQVTPTPRATAVAGVQMPSVEVGTVAVTVADEGLRMRSLPGLEDASQAYTPKLPMGTTLFVLDGPVEADGYAWYQVAPIGTDFPSRWGWVAVASREGVPWLEHGAVGCPPTPDDVRMLYAYDFGTVLACFGRQPITLAARILDCNCSIDPGESIEPSSFQWQFTDDGAGPLVLVPSGTNSASGYESYAALLRVASDADVPDRLPVGVDVQVTGMFDHPVAADCRYDEAFDGNAEPSPYCRGLFLVTSIR